MEVVDAINRVIWVLGGIGAIVVCIAWLIQRFSPPGPGGR